MSTLRDWVVSVIGNPVFHEVYENPNWTGTGTRYSTVTVQYDWAFICSAVIFVICLIGFISLVRMAFGGARRRR